MIRQRVRIITPQKHFLFQCCSFRDRCRTMANVMGDSIGAGIVQHLSRDQLEKYDDPESPGATIQLHPVPEIESRQL